MHIPNSSLRVHNHKYLIVSFRDWLILKDIHENNRVKLLILSFAIFMRQLKRYRKVFNKITEENLQKQVFTRYGVEITLASKFKGTDLVLSTII